MSLFVESERRRLRSLWRLVIQYALYLTATVLLTFAASLALSGFGALGGGPSSSPASGALQSISAVATLVAVFLSLWIAGRFLDRRRLSDFGFHLSGAWWVDFGFGLLLGAFLMSGVFLVQLAAGWIEVTGSLETGGTPFSLAILPPLVLFICVGFYEESLSRGYQLKNLAEGVNFRALGGPKGAVLFAWIISSAFFGLLHLGNPNASAISTFNVALAGILLGAGYVLTGELAIPIGLHIAWNFFEGNVFGFPVSGLTGLGASFLTTEQSGPELWTGGSFGPEAGLLDPAAVVAGVLLTVLWVRARNGWVGIHSPLAEGPEPVGNAATSAAKPAGIG